MGERERVRRQRAEHGEPELAPPIVHEALASPGRPLDEETRAFMEPRFGHDFSRVRLHTDARAAESAEAVNALAYTVGQDIVFGAGQYQPGTSEGRRLIAHELAHTVQQQSSSVVPSTVLRLPSEEGIQRGDHEFSTHCGWIDWGHANPTKAREVLRSVRAAKPGSVFTSRMSTWSHSGSITVQMITRLTPAQELSTALGIFQTLSMLFEEAQSDTDFLRKTGFSVEDLPSNLIGFYRAAKGYGVPEIRSISWPWGKKASLDRYRYDKKRGFFENSNPEFTPPELPSGGSWPAELRSIIPEPPGVHWRVVHRSLRGPLMGVVTDGQPVVPLWPKLVIGGPQDAYEQEADNIAAHIVSASWPLQLENTKYSISTPGWRSTSRDAWLLQRQTTLPEIEIRGDPDFYSRAERANHQYAQQLEVNGWPYISELRRLWESRQFDTFAEQVRALQEEKCGFSEQEADGILGPRTARLIRQHRTRDEETRQLGETRHHHSRERMLTPQETGELYIRENPTAPVDPEEIEMARAEIRIEELRSREDEFINTDVLAPMPVASGRSPNIRTRAFSSLIESLRKQSSLEQQLEELQQGQSNMEAADLHSLQQQWDLLRDTIREQARHAIKIALTWYRQQETKVGVDVTPVEPRVAPGRRMDRPSTGRGSRSVRMYYIRRAIEALESGQLLHRYRRVEYLGHVSGRRIHLRPVRFSPKVDRPEGHYGSGIGYHQGVLKQRVQEHSKLPDEHRPMALNILSAFRRLEGSPMSLNTWDSAVLTLGSGIAARGRLQETFHQFKQANPQMFHALFGRYGLDVYSSGNSHGLSVQVPRQPLGPEYQPGDVLVGEQAIEYIVKDPVLLVQLRRAGHALGWQQFLADNALDSVCEALSYTFHGLPINQLLRGLPAELAQGVYFALSNAIHGQGIRGLRQISDALENTWKSIQHSTSLSLEQLIADEQQPLRYREQLAVAMIRVVDNSRLNGFLAELPELGAHL